MVLTRLICLWIATTTFVLCLENSLSINSINSLDLLIPSNEFDILIFTQHWPITVCDEWKEHGQSHECLLPPNKDSWTIHGIWPTKFGTKGPFFCNSSWIFDPSQVRDIEGILEQKWINIEKNTSTYGLWSHEWSKHGTCAAIVPQLSNEHKYFTQGLLWLEHFSMDKILSSSDITPSSVKLYSVLNIHRAIRNALKVNAAIECREDHKVSYLFELRLCFDKSLKLVDCNGVVTSRIINVNGNDIVTNCDPTKGVLYPENINRKNYIVQFYRLVSWIKWITL